MSVIVSVYNEERHVAECLESLLAQTYSPLEIIVADDGSTDGTAAIVGRFEGVRLLQRPHEGKARAVNASAAEATGDILFFLDGDLRFDREYVARLAAPIIAGTAVGTSHFEEFVANQDNIWSRCQQAYNRLPPDRRISLTAEQVAAGTVVFRAIRRDVFLEAGGFDDTGYLDDQSLSPKIGKRAVFVAGAICHHHNTERLAEVFAAGVWAGKSVHHLHGPRAALRYFPLVASVGAAREALSLRMPAILVYLTVYHSGVFWGVAKRTLGIDRTLGA